MSADLTLWHIESALLELLDAREEADTPEAVTACDEALAEYVAREVQKVDNIRGLIKHCQVVARAAREEARDQEARARAWERREERVKAFVQVVMEQFNLPRLEGRAGRLMLKGNGGLKPLEITDPAVIPEECVRYAGWISGRMMRQLREELNFALLSSADMYLERVVDNDAVRRALKTCEVCHGSGEVTVDAEYSEACGGTCPACAGSGLGGVPGARLRDRGKHVEVK